MNEVANTAIATLATLGMSVTIAASFIVIGLSLRRWFGLTRHDIDDVLQAFWLGFGTVLTLLLVANFLWPIRQVAFWTLLASAILLWLAGLRRDEFILSRPPRWATLAAVAFCLWVSNLSLGAMGNFDTALYHMQGVRWAHEYPVVPGLANLFGPLGFNNASFVYNAILNVGPWNGASWHVSNGVFVCVLGVQLLVAASRRPASAHGLFCLLLLPVAVNGALDGRVTSYSTAILATLIALAIGVAISRAFAEDRSDQERAFDMFTAVGLGATAVAIKSSAGVFTAATAAVAVWVFMTRVASSAVRRRAFGWSVAFVGTTAAAWLSRGILLSGYPLFPSPVLGLPVDWRVPLDHARAEFDFVRHSALATAEKYAYVAGELQGFFVWFRPWAKSALYDLYDVVFPGLIAVAAAVALTVRWKNLSAMRTSWLLATTTPALLAILAWWMVAPMPHYGSSFFWLAAAGLATAALGGGSRFTRSRATRVTLFVLIVSPVFVTPAWPRIFRGEEPSRVFAAVKTANFRSAPRGQWFETDGTRKEWSPFTTASGLVLEVPQNKFGRCWDAPGLCTPNPAPNLRLRVPDRIDRGFAVDGEWQMVGWPEPWRAELLPAMRKYWKKGGT